MAPETLLSPPDHAGLVSYMVDDVSLEAAFEAAANFVRTMRLVNPIEPMPILKADGLTGYTVEVRRDAQSIDIMIKLRR